MLNCLRSDLVKYISIPVIFSERQSVTISWYCCPSFIRDASVRGFKSVTIEKEKDIPGEPKKLTSLTGYGIKSVPPVFATKMLIYQPKANLDEITLLGKIIHLLDPKIRKVPIRDFI